MAYLRQNIWQKTNWIERCQLTLTCRIIGIFFSNIATTVGVAKPSQVFTLCTDSPDRNSWL